MLQKVSVIILLFLVYTSISSAQEKESKESRVIWGVSRTCSELNVAEVKLNNPGCSKLELDGKYYYLTSYDGITTAINWLRTDDYVRVLMQITNASGKDIQFEPEESKILFYKDQLSFLNGGKALKASKSITAKQARTRAEYRVNVRNMSAIMNSGGSSTPVGTTVSTTQTRVLQADGSTTTKIESTASNKGSSEATQALSQARAKLSDNAMSAFNSAFEGQLIANNDKVAGYIFFLPVPKNDTFKVFQIKVGKLTFVFPPNILSVQKQD
jgi:hypothetical protein